MKKLFFIITLTFTILLLTPKIPAFASGFSVGIYPPITKINQQPQAKSTIPIFIQNYDKNDSVDLNFQVRPFVPSDKLDGQAEVVPETTTLNSNYQTLFTNIKFFDGDTQITHLILSPTQRKQVNLELDLPENFPQGDYYFSFIAKSNTTSLDDTNLSSIVGAIASNIILTVGQADKPKGIIQNFSTPLLVVNGPVPISLTVENTTKNVITPYGSITIQNVYGQTVGALRLLPVNILSHSSRFIPDNKSNSKTEIIWNEKNPLGIYKVHLTLALSPQGPLFDRTIYFLATPIKLILVIVIIFILIITITSRVIKKLTENNL